ncbi:MAG: hypothetical protein COA78_20250 [Blastopirellula sp.]|nr:MAG: hypothetical protein COA78_20250 [Blastopirellula sp.]
MILLNPYRFASAGAALVFESSTVTTPTGSNPSITVPTANSGDRLVIVLGFIASDIPTANGGGYIERLNDTSNVNIQYAVYEKTAGLSEPTSVGFTAPFGNFVGVGLRWSGAQSGGTDGTENFAYSTTITADSITVTSGSDVIEVYLARSSSITKSGTTQNALNSSVSLAVKINEDVASTSIQTATIAASNHVFGNQIEILKA